MGLTTTTLAGQAGISQSQLSKLENGKAAISILTLTELSRIFDRPLSYLFQKDEEVERQSHYPRGLLRHDVRCPHRRARR
jgi:transcriptional regulator with XRE-family HTH domain